MASIDISPELNQIVGEMAKRRECKRDEAAEFLITKGVQKYNAERKYFKKKAAKEAEVTKPTKAKAKALKAAKPTKAPKAKGPKVAKAKAAKEVVAA